MYKVTKDRGGYSTVTLEDTETCSTTLIGKLSHNIIKVLERSGLTFDTTKEGAIDMYTAWNFEVSRETAHELSELTMAMKKPIRTQKIKTEQKVEAKEPTMLTALDIIFGD